MVKLVRLFKFHNKLTFEFSSQNNEEGIWVWHMMMVMMMMMMMVMMMMMMATVECNWFWCDTITVVLTM